MVAPAAAAGAVGAGAKALGWIKGIGTVLGAAAPLFGGGGGDRSNESKWAITRRVRDAQRAGIHPLYALGSAGANMPSLATGNAFGDAIGNLGSVAASYADAELRRRQPAATPSSAELSESAARVAAMQADARSKDAQAAYYHSLTAKNAQSLVGTGRDAGALSVIEPARITASEPGQPGRVAGPPQPAMVEVEIPDTGGETIMIPNQGAGFEVPESVGGGMMIMRKLYQWLNEVKSHHRPTGQRPRVQHGATGRW